MSENNSGGLADRSNGNAGGGLAGAGGVSGGGASNQSGGSNYGSAYGGTPNKNATGAYGITGMTTPRRDQTLQDRMFENLGGGMVGTDIGGRLTSNGGSSMGSGLTGSTPRPVVAPPRRNPLPTSITPPTQVPPTAPPVPPEIIPGFTGYFNYNDWAAGQGFPVGGWASQGPGVTPGGPPGGWGSGSIGNWGGTGTYNGSSKDQSQIGGLADGGMLQPGQMAYVGERGPEIAQNVGGTTHVTPLDRPGGGPMGMGGGQGFGSSSGGWMGHPQRSPGAVARGIFNPRGVV